MMFRRVTLFSKSRDIMGEKSLGKYCICLKQLKTRQSKFNVCIHELRFNKNLALIRRFPFANVRVVCVCRLPRVYINVKFAVAFYVWVLCRIVYYLDTWIWRTFLGSYRMCRIALSWGEAVAIHRIITIWGRKINVYKSY